MSIFMLARSYLSDKAGSDIHFARIQFRLLQKILQESGEGSYGLCKHVKKHIKFYEVGSHVMEWV